MLSFKMEIEAIAASVADAKRKAVEGASKPTEREKRKAHLENTEKHRELIITFLSTRPPRKRWATSEEISKLINLETRQTSMVMCRLRAKKLVVSRRLKSSSCKVEWRVE